MRPQVNDTVSLNNDLPNEHLPKGSLGVVVFVFSEPEEAYEIESCDENGATIAQVTLRLEHFTTVRQSPEDNGASNSGISSS